MTLMRSDGDPQQQGHFSWHLHLLTAGSREKCWEKNQGGPEILRWHVLVKAKSIVAKTYSTAAESKNLL